MGVEKDRPECVSGVVTAGGLNNGMINPEAKNRNEFVLRIFMEHKDALARLLARSLVASESVSDALQEIYLRLTQMRDIEPLEANPKAYLFRMAVNLARDGMRKKYTRRAQFHFPLNAEELKSSEPSPEDSVDRSQQMHLLKDACSSLTRREKRTLFLHCVSKLTNKEIAVDMGVSSKTVARTLTQTISYLQTQLKKQGQE